METIEEVYFSDASSFDPSEYELKVKVMKHIVLFVGWQGNPSHIMVINSLKIIGGHPVEASSWAQHMVD